MRGPRRLVRKRGRGSHLPAGAIYVGRPTTWANPFRITRSSDYHGLAGSWFVTGPDGDVHHPAEDTQRSARRTAVELYARHLAEGRDPRLTEALVRSELSGRDLACWCPAGQPCHVDVLLRVANEVEPSRVPAARSTPGVCPGCGQALGSTSVLEPTDRRLALADGRRRPTCPHCGRDVPDAT